MHKKNLKPKPLDQNQNTQVKNQYTYIFSHLLSQNTCNLGNQKAKRKNIKLELKKQTLNRGKQVCFGRNLRIGQ